MTAKERYRKLCQDEMSIPIFSRDWWLDAVAGDDWNVCIVEKGDEIAASMPYVVKKRFGLTLLTQPSLTQTLGPWIRADYSKHSKRLAHEKDLMQALIDELPSHDYFSQNWHYSVTNWLPFYWCGFSQTTRYTYVLYDISSLEKIVSGFEYSKRKNIKKSELLVEVVFDISAEEFYKNHKMTLKKQGARISYDFELFKNIYDEGYRRNQAKTIAAYDKNGSLHAALFVVWDGLSAYDLISTIDPDYRTYGAASLLVREIIKYTSQFVTRFDFEGSMIEGVERSFRQFGARQTPYFRVSRSNSKLFKLLSTLRSLRSCF